MSCTERHAIKINLWGRKNLAYNNDGTRGYRWPAKSADASASTSYLGTNPSLEMGALLALKQNFDVSGLSTVPARIIATALKNYGAYVVDDTGWDHTGFSVEVGPNGSVLDEFKGTYGYSFYVQQSSNTPWVNDLLKIISSLNVVDNNLSTAIGGGGAPLQPLAPPFDTAPK